MKITTSKILKRAILAMAPFIFICCEKPNDELGLRQVIGSQADLKDTTLDVISYTVDVDSIPVTFAYQNQLSIGGYTGNRLVGSRLDGHFGRAEASTVAQMILNTVNVDFGENPVVDSVRLFLRYAGSYGDTSIPMNLEVLEITESLSRDAVFYSNFEPQTGTKIGEKTDFTPKPKSSVRIHGDEVDATLSIPMDASYFQENFADVADGTFEGLSSNDLFVDYFKGIHIRTTNTDGSILYFNLNNLNSRLIIYYHNDQEDDLRLNLSFSQESSTVPMHFSTFSQDYESYDTDFDLNNMDESGGENTTYVQAMGGVATVLKIKDVIELLDENVLINRAVLQIPMKSGTGSALPPPPRLEIRELTEGEPGAAITDFRAGSAGAAQNGIFRSEEFKQGYYSFDISRYFFDVVNGGEELDLLIVPVIKSTAAHQVILQGGENSGDPIELKLYYTKQ